MKTSTTGITARSIFSLQSISIPVKMSWPLSSTRAERPRTCDWCESFDVRLGAPYPYLAAICDYSQPGSWYRPALQHRKLSATRRIPQDLTRMQYPENCRSGLPKQPGYQKSPLKPWSDSLRHLRQIEPASTSPASGIPRRRVRLYDLLCIAHLMYRAYSSVVYEPDYCC